MDKFIQATIEDAGFKVCALTALHAAHLSDTTETYERKGKERSWLLTVRGVDRFTLQSFRHGSQDRQAISYMLTEPQLAKACGLAGIELKTAARDACKAECAEQAQELQKLKSRIAKMGGEGSGQKGHTTMQQLKQKLHDGGVDFDTLGKTKDGHYIGRKGYYWGITKSSQPLADKVKAALPDHDIVDHGNHYAPFKGGASTRAGSHMWVKFKPKEKMMEHEEPSPATKVEGMEE